MTPTDSRIDLNLFRVLDAIDSHGGISAAARALHLTQPAVTHALNRLREALGDPLFVRQGNRMLPTHRTRSMMPQVRLHLRGLQSTTHTPADFLPSQLQLVFTVGFRDVLESIAFPPLIATIGAQAPKVHVVSRRVATAQVSRELIAGEVDLVVDRRHSAEAPISSHHLGDETLVVAMRRDHPLARGKLKRADYLGARHVAVSALGEAVPLDVLLAQDGRAREIQLLCQHYFSACQVVVASDLLLTMPHSYAAGFARLLPVVTQPLPFKLRPIPIMAYWHRSRDEDRAHQWFREQVIATIAGTATFGVS